MNSAARREAFHHAAGSPNLTQKPWSLCPGHSHTTQYTFWSPSWCTRLVGGTERDRTPLPLGLHLFLKQRKPGLAAETLVAGRRWVEAQSQAGNKNGGEELGLPKGKPAEKENQAKK